MASKTTTYVLEGDTDSLVAAVDAGAQALDRIATTSEKASKAVDKTGKESKKAAGGVDKLGKSSLFSAKNMALLAGGTLATGAAVGALIQKMADAQNQLSNLSLRTGVATGTLAGLKLAAAGSGQTLEDMQSVLEPMIERIGQAAAGAESAAAGFRSLGVDVLDTEGNMKSADAVLKEVAKGLASMEDPTKRATAAALAFGGAGTRLVQALGTADLQTFIDAAEQFGMDTGPEAAKAAEDWQKAIADLDMVTTAFSTGGMKLATAAVDDFSAGLVVGKVWVQEYLNVWNDLIASFKTLPAVFGALAPKEGQSWMDWVLMSLPELEARVAAIEAPAQRVQKSFAEISAEAEAAGLAFMEYQKASRSVEKGAGGLKGGLKGSKDGVENLAAAWGPLIEQIEAGAAAIDAIAESNRFGLTEEDKLRDAYDKKIVQLGEIEIQTKKNLALIDEEIVKAREKGDATEELTEAQREGALSLIKIEQQRVASIEALTDAVGKLGTTQEEHLAMVGDVASKYEEAFGAAIDFVMSQNEVLTNSQRNMLLTLYRLQQAAAITSIIIDTAEGIMKYAKMGPLGIAGAVAIGALGATQVALVSATPPPFHVGGIIPDGAGLASVLPGESVLTREATAKLGTEGVRDLNSGMGSPTLVIEQIYKHKIFDSFVQDNINKGGPLASAIRGTSRVGRA